MYLQDQVEKAAPDGCVSQLAQAVGEAYPSHSVAPSVALVQKFPSTHATLACYEATYSHYLTSARAMGLARERLRRTPNRSHWPEVYNTGVVDSALSEGARSDTSK